MLAPAPRGRECVLEGTLLSHQGFLEAFCSPQRAGPSFSHCGPQGRALSPGGGVGVATCGQVTCKELGLLQRSAAWGPLRPWERADLERVQTCACSPHPTVGRHISLHILIPGRWPVGKGCLRSSLHRQTCGNQLRDPSGDGRVADGASMERMRGRRSKCWLPVARKWGGG